MKSKKVRLSKSVRKNIRKKKEKLRKKHGPKSSPEEDLSAQIKILKERKLARHR